MSDLQQISESITNFYSKLVTLFMNLEKDEKISWIIMIVGVLFLLVGLIMLIL